MIEEPALQIELDAGGVIGSRPLRALQLVRIGRHTSSAILVPRDGIWVVAGRGPEAGSNGAGKTVLLGAISLLNGDAQWRGDSGIGPNAARLLFDHNRARVSDPTLGDALHGYIAGVYLKPGQIDGAISVWMRIERHGPDYVQVRWTQGIRLADGDTEKARVANADVIWESLRGQKTLKVTEYAEALHGSAPRCIAYIRARGSEENQDRGLLALGQRPFRPIDLANQIINLAGKRQALEYERQFRVDLAASQTALESKRKAYEVQYQREERELQEIANRRQARSQLISASKSWDLFLTIGAILEHWAAKDQEKNVADLERTIKAKEETISLKKRELRNLPDRPTLIQRLDLARTGLKRASKTRDDIIKESAVKQNRKEVLDEEQARLQKITELAPDMSITDAEAALESAEQRRRTAERATGVIESRCKEKRKYLAALENGRGGPAGEALEALEAEGIRAVSVLDLINLSDDSRTQWEARLSPYANTIVLNTSDSTVVDRARRLLTTKHPGTPVVVNPLVMSPSDVHEDGSQSGLEDFLNALQRRMPAADPGWVVDPELKLEIPGGFRIPLTDRQAAIAAARAELEELNEQLQEALNQQKRVKAALEAATAAVELLKVQAELTTVKDRLTELEGMADAAETNLSMARDSFQAAQKAVEDLDERIADLEEKIDQLQHGKEGIIVFRQELADARQKFSSMRSIAINWKGVAAIQDLDAAQARLAVGEVVISNTARDAWFHQARTDLRRAIAAVHVAQESDEGSAEHASNAFVSDELNQKLNSDLTELHNWCEKHQAATPQTFEHISRPLTSWLEWNGAEDHIRESEINADRRNNEEQIKAAERREDETRQWIMSQRDIQIAVIDKAFRDTERTLNNLLKSVNKDPIKLRPRNTDVQDVEQPLRWELHPQWVPSASKPVEYTNPPNTAELIILHVLLATASLVAATNPQGRMLILDESGNNLDGPNLSKVSEVLKQISETHGLTIILACQDIYTDRVARFSAGTIQLLRHSRSDALNAPPTIMHGREEPELVDALLPYLSLARPTRTS